MKLMFLGPPGAGKGTQAARVSERLNIPQISTGDILRAAMRDETPVGLVAKGYVDKGELVPDSVVIQIVAERLTQPDCRDGFILDGFPRTLAQAEVLSSTCDLDAVINLSMDDEAIVRRLSGRRVCASCGATYHEDRLGGRTTCEKCGQALIQRKDDQPETVRNRLAVYHAQTAPLEGYYDRAGLLKTVDGALSLDEGFYAILTALGVDP
ncbi:MAG TPA: adenylate kinase [Clostridia bacterium]|nr:adenylate kinase [Clostridia bacterium]